MSTITISLSGSAITGLTTAGGPVQKVYTVNDTDLQSVLNWSQVAFATQLTSSVLGSTNPATNAQILAAWLQGGLVNGTIQAVQQFQTSAPVVPPQITIS